MLNYCSAIDPRLQQHITQRMAAVNSQGPPSSTAVLTRGGNIPEDSPPPPPGAGRDLVHKMKTLRSHLNAMQPQAGHCKLEVSRENVFEESYRHIMKMRVRDLKKKLHIRFRGRGWVGLWWHC